MKLKDMPKRQQVIVALLTAALIIFSVIGFFAPRGSTLAWQMQRFIFFTPGLILGYSLGLWVGQSKPNKK